MRLQQGRQGVHSSSVTLIARPQDNVRGVPGGPVAQLRPVRPRRRVRLHGGARGAAEGPCGGQVQGIGRGQVQRRSSVWFTYDLCPNRKPHWAQPCPERILAICYGQAPPRTSRRSCAFLQLLSGQGRLPIAGSDALNQDRWLVGCAGTVSSRRRSCDQSFTRSTPQKPNTLTSR